MTCSGHVLLGQETSLRKKGEVLLGQETSLRKKGKTPEQFSSNIGEIIAIRKIKVQTSTLNYFKEYEIQKGQDYAKIRELNFQCLINENAYGISVSISLSQDKKIGEYIFAIVTIYLSRSKCI
jgi:hypothetical protein